MGSVQTTKPRVPHISLVFREMWDTTGTRPATPSVVISTGGVMGRQPTPKVTKNGLGPASTLYGTVALSFVIPSEAEGSAVPRTFRRYVFRESGAQREICGFF